MAQRLTRDFCIWVVPPHDGRVKKVRFTVTRLAIAASLSIVIFAGLFYVMGDYARAKLVLARNYISMHLLRTERNRLVSDKADLERKVEELEEKNSKAFSYHEHVKERVKRLEEVILDATNLGVSAGSKSPDRDGGIGGAELECEALVAGGCSAVDAQVVPLSFFSPQRSLEELKVEEDLVSLLDRYLDLLNVIPLAEPMPGRFTSGFGYRRSPFGGGIKMHEGIDLAAPTGTPVAATARGVVKSVKYDRTYGHVVDIEHTDRLMTRYAHLRKATVKVGQKVERGDRIGLCGSTGRSTGPHLHYEIRVAGRAINPKKFFNLAERVAKALL